MTQTTHGNQTTGAAGKLALCYVLVFIAAVILYGPMFGVKPAGDDFAAPLLEIQRGNVQGPMALLLHSAQPHNYRPLQSLSMWVLGHVSASEPLPWVHVLGLIGLAGYFAAGWVWCREIGLTLGSATVAALVLASHPVLVGAVAGIDGYSGLDAAAFIWLGAWWAFHFARKPVLAAAGACVCFLIGSLFKEYTFALLVIGPLMALLGASRPQHSGAATPDRAGAPDPFQPASTNAPIPTRVFAAIRKMLNCPLDERCWLGGLVTGVALALCLAVLIAIRRITIPPGMGGGFNYIDVDPLSWIRNLGLLVLSVAFVGDAGWVVTGHTWTIWLSTAAISALAVGLVVVGCRLRRTAAFAGRGGIAVAASPVQQPAVWCLALAGSMFPAVITRHVSEMYSVGMVLPAAMLAALAAQGWRSSPPRRCSVAFLLGVGLLAIACLALRSKVGDLIYVGQKAQEQLQQVMTHVPSDARNWRVALVYSPSAQEYQRCYSIYRMRDDQYLGTENALEWVAPGRDLKVVNILLEPGQTLAPGHYDMVLRWDPVIQDYRQWADVPTLVTTAPAE